MAIGALISAALLGLEWLSGDTFAFLSWQMPGISAAYLFWGATGGPASMGIAIAGFVNAVAFGAAAFAVLSALKLLTLALPK